MENKRRGPGPQSMIGSSARGHASPAPSPVESIPCDLENLTWGHLGERAGVLCFSISLVTSNMYGQSLFLGHPVGEVEKHHLMLKIIHLQRQGSEPYT